jgi:hypothetical protein|tara:strand:- start:455 stop:658 length:204 start_codon:yes stop_codon:yes gene_type:complete
MKLKIYHLKHASNGLRMEVVPETQQEHETLHALWTHGVLDTIHSTDNHFGSGLVVRWKREEDEKHDG